MALNEEYFSSIDLEIAKKKYYNANKVEAVLQDIRQQALELDAENRLLRQQLDALTSQKSEIGDALLSARTISQGIIDDARAEADAIIADAKEQSRQILSSARGQQDYMVSCVQSCYDKIRAQQYEIIDTVNREWQNFLCGLDAGEDAPTAEAVKAPEDLSEKVNAIAKELLSMMGDNEEE